MSVSISQPFKAIKSPSDRETKMEKLVSYLFAIVILLAVNEISYVKVGATSPHNNIYAEPKTYNLDVYQMARDCDEIMDANCTFTPGNGTYYIKPDGHPGFFKTYCKSDRDGQGWTVIHARDNTDSAKVVFNRSWEDYRLGFGSENNFWIGNEKLAYLTNQRKYQLRIDWTMADGSYHVIYDNFRISDEFGNYSISSEIRGDNKTAYGAVKWCPTNTHYGHCDCQGTCSNTSECVPCPKHEICVCPKTHKVIGDDCVLEEECGCPYNESTNYRIREGGYTISSDCARNCSCVDRNRTCVDYRCSPHATCGVRNNERRCYCDENYVGNGTHCKRVMDCWDVFELGRESGEYKVQPISGYDNVTVKCDMDDGGGWTVFQRRFNGSVNFFRSRKEYKDGFGSGFGSHDEFWLGNEILHILTKQRRYELKIELVDKEGKMFYARYDLFSIDSENDSYTLHIGNFTDGGAGNPLTNYSDNQPFQVEVDSTWSGFLTLAPLHETNATDFSESSGSGEDLIYSGSDYSVDSLGTETMEINYGDDGDSDWIANNVTDNVIGPWWHPPNENIPKACDLNGNYRDIYWETVSRTNIIKSTKMKIRPLQENV